MRSMRTRSKVTFGCGRRDGEEFLALDGKTYRLESRQVVIADDQRALALGGVMGGRRQRRDGGDAQYPARERAFHGPNIRRTSRALGLASDSSYRFERGRRYQRSDGRIATGGCADPGDCRR